MKNETAPETAEEFANTVRGCCWTDRCGSDYCEATVLSDDELWQVIRERDTAIRRQERERTRLETIEALRSLVHHIIEKRLPAPQNCTPEGLAKHSVLRDLLQDILRFQGRPIASESDEGAKNDG